MMNSNSPLPIELTADDNTRKIVVVIASTIIWISGIYMILKLFKK